VPLLVSSQFLHIIKFFVCQFVSIIFLYLTNILITLNDMEETLIMAVSEVVRL